jgi:hypothetical protein
MSGLPKILPGTGRGTARSVVEGVGVLKPMLRASIAPSVSFAATSPFRGGIRP